MTKKIIKISTLLIIMLILSICFMQIPSKAAGGFSASAAKTGMTVGESTTFTVTASGCGGKFTISSSDPSVISISGNTTEWIENGNHTVTLKANKAGSATITATAVDVADSSTGNEITGSRSVTINVSNPAPVNNGSNGSGDASLKSITVAGKTYTNPGTDFTVNVGANVGSAEIKAVANSSSARVSGTGSKELVTGTNIATITVTAENGAKRTYTIRIRKLADTNTTPNVVEEPTNNEAPQEQTPEIIDLRLEYLRIDDAELVPEFDSQIFEYTIEVTNKDSIDIVAKANVEDAIVEITGNKELVDGENEILIKITKEGQQEVEYRIIVNKTTEVVVVPEEVSENSTGGFLSTTGGKITLGGVGVATIGALGFGIWKAKSAAGMASRARRAASRRSMFDDFND